MPHIVLIYDYGLLTFYVYDPYVYFVRALQKFSIITHKSFLQRLTFVTNKYVPNINFYIFSISFYKA